MTVIGNLTADPELRFTQAGKPMLTGSIADNRRYQINGEWHEETSYLNYVVWGELAENAAATLRKGMRVVTTGRLQQRSYEDKEGNKRTSYDFVIDEIAPSLKWATALVSKTERQGDTPTASRTAMVNEPEVVNEDPF
jgi:single-strand DNA-binding protein